MKHGLLISLLRTLKRLIVLTSVFLYDFLFYIKHSGTFYNFNASVHKYLILKDLHKIEKGLSLANPKKNFGQAVWTRIENNLSKSENIPTQLTEYVLQVHKRYSEENSITKDETNKFFSELNSNRDIKPKQILTAETSSETRGQNFDMILRKRRSVRNFNRPVPFFVLTKMRDLIKNTPTVCNRAHLDFKIVDENLINEVLMLQNGNATFRQEIKQVLIVYSELSSMSSPYERHQSFIDGGMYSMNLLNYLAFEGYGTCPLNWCTSPHQDKKLRRILSLPPDAIIIMLVAIGVPAVGAMVPTSTKLKLSAV